MSTVRRLHHTYDEYLKALEVSVVKLEYSDGEIYAMAGGTPAHAELAAAIVRLVGNALLRRCSVYSSDLKVRIEATDFSTFPDAAVVCGNGEYCQANEVCLSGRCTNNGCISANGAANGSSCKAATDCASANCINSLRKGTAMIGDACANAADCSVGTCCSTTSKCGTSCQCRLPLLGRHDRKKRQLGAKFRKVRRAPHGHRYADTASTGHSRKTAIDRGCA